MALKKLIFRRTTHDWSGMKTIDDFIASNDANEPPFKKWIPRVARAIEIWNRISPISWFEFRHELKQIAEILYRDIGATIIHSISQLPEENYICVPVDDDDWLAPNLFEVLEKNFSPEHDVYLWANVRAGRNKLVMFNPGQEVGGHCLCHPCNSALSPYFVNQFIDDPFCLEHGKIDAKLKNCAFNEKLMPNEFLSVYVQSPASCSFLFNPGGNEMDEIELRTAIGTFKEYLVPESLHWANSSFKKLWKLIFKLQRRTMFV